MDEARLPAGFLALPEAGDRTLERMLRKVRLLAARALLTLSPAHVDPGERRDLVVSQRALAEALSGTPQRALRAIGAPDVLPSLLALHGGHAPPATCLRALPALERGLRGHDAPSEPRWEIGPGMELTTRDTNPMAWLEEHPDKSGNAPDLGGRDGAEWLGALRDAIALVAHLPRWHAELPLALQRVVPVGFAPERHLSASYREAPGLIYLSLHPSPLTLAEAVIHEVQHSKLNLLSWLDPVLVNGRTTWTPSPVRPDLRPLMGVLLAAHAFVPVAALHLALATADHPVARGPAFARRRDEVLAGNERALTILAELADPTPTGRRVLASLAALHAVTRAAGPQTLPLDALPPA